MKIRLMTDRITYGAIQHEGDVIDFPDAEANRMIGSRQAERINGEAETATVAASESAMIQRGNSPRRKQ